MSDEQKKFLLAIKRRKICIVSLQFMLLVSFFTLWEVAGCLNWINPFIMSQPSRMFTACMSMIEDGSLFYHCNITFWETVIGFVLGTIIGTSTAIILWWSPFCSRVLEPYLVVLNSLPKTALAPILIVWLGNNQNSIIMVALLTSTIVTILNVLNGFLQVDEEKIKLIQIFGGTKFQVLQKVVVPANIPCIMNALKINVGLSFVGVIVGEFLVAKAGLGYLIIYGSQVFKFDWVMLSVLMLALMAVVLYQMIALFERLMIRNHQ